MPTTTIGVEQARGRLGRIVDAVAAGGGPVTFTKRGAQAAVLLSQTEYERLKDAASRRSRGELQGRLRVIREQVAAARLDPSVVDEAIKSVRRSR